MKKADMERKMSLQDAVSLILRSSAGMECGQADALTKMIIHQARHACGLIRAVEERYASSCAEENDWGKVLLDLQICRYDRYICEQGEPMYVNLIFSGLLDAMKKDGGKCMGMEARKWICEELSVRNTLFGALETGKLDVEEPLEPDETAIRNCAYTLTMWIKDKRVDGAEAEDGSEMLPALEAAILDRIGYLDHDRIEQLHTAVQERMDEMNQNI